MVGLASNDNLEVFPRYQIIDFDSGMPVGGGFRSVILSFEKFEGEAGEIVDLFVSNGHVLFSFMNCP